MARRVELTPRAREDIVDIAAYTARTWGDAQMARYVDGLDRRLLELATAPTRLPIRRDLGAGVRRAGYGAHVVFFRPLLDGILVLRVLHGAQDHPRHLAPDDAEGL